MNVTVMNPPINAREMTERYITARYSCSLIEFARQLEKELLTSNVKATTGNKIRDASGGGKCGRAANVQQAGD